MILRTSAIAAICLLAGCDGGGNTSVQPAPPISNVAAFMGDSITHRWDLTQYDPNPTVNFGVDGDSTAQMLARFDAVIAIAPGVVVILGGINDGATSNTDSIKAMAAQATAAGIRVILCSVLPFSFQGQDLDQAHIASLNQELIDLAQANGYLYADYFDVMINPDGSQNQSLFVDGLHPNAAGYAKMWAVIAPLLAEDLN
jgi:lysophospholipase L1-like esterase